MELKPPASSDKGSKEEPPGKCCLEFDEILYQSERDESVVVAAVRRGPPRQSVSFPMHTEVHCQRQQNLRTSKPFGQPSGEERARMRYIICPVEIGVPNVWRHVALIFHTMLKTRLRKVPCRRSCSTSSSQA